jgi:hypothetical protein
MQKYKGKNTTKYNVKLTFVSKISLKLKENI